MSGGTSQNRVDLPFVGDSLELVPASILKLNARSSYEITNGSRHQDFAATRSRSDAGRGRLGRRLDLRATAQEEKRREEKKCFVQGELPLLLWCGRDLMIVN